MDAINSLTERVDRIAAMVETAILNHASEGAEAVARGVQTHAVAAIATWGVLVLILAIAAIRLARWTRRLHAVNEGSPSEIYASSDERWIPAAAATTVIAIVLVIVLIAGAARGPSAILAATDPVAAIARAVVLK